MIVFRPTFRDHKTGEKRTTEHYYLRHRGKRYPLHLSDRRAAEAKAREIINQLELGYDPKTRDAARKEGLLSLLEEFLASLAHRTGKTHREGLEQRLKKVFAETGATLLPDLTSQKVVAWLRDCGLAKRTVHHYRRHLLQFSRWLQASGRLPRAPLEIPPVANVDSDRRHQRRSLDDQELAALVAAAAASKKKRCGMDGPTRSVLYLLLANTGLRRGEVATVAPSSFFFAKEEGGVSYVRVRASCSKNKKETTQPIPDAVVGTIRDYVEGQAERPLWKVHRQRTSDMIRADLAEAGVEAVQGDRTFDLHALRTSYITNLAKAGVQLALCSRLARHCTVELTSKYYVVANAQDLLKEVNKLSPKTD